MHTKHDVWSVLVAVLVALGLGACGFFSQPIVCGYQGKPPCGDPDITKAPSPSELPSASSKVPTSASEKHP